MNPIDRIVASRTASPSSRARPIDRDRDRVVLARRAPRRARGVARCRSIVDRARAATRGRGDRPTDRPTDRPGVRASHCLPTRTRISKKSPSILKYMDLNAHIMRVDSRSRGIKTPRARDRSTDRPTRRRFDRIECIECVGAVRRARRRWRRRWSNRWRTWRARRTSCGTR